MIAAPASLPSTLWPARRVVLFEKPSLASRLLLAAVMPLDDSLRELAWRRTCHSWIESGKKGPCGPDEF
jgi:hypothetical protein